MSTWLEVHGIHGRMMEDIWVWPAGGLLWDMRCSGEAWKEERIGDRVSLYHLPITPVSHFHL